MFVDLFKRWEEAEGGAQHYEHDPKNCETSRIIKRKLH